MRRFVGVLILAAALGACSEDGSTANTRGAIGAVPTRTPWQMHHGLEQNASNPLGLLQFTCAPARHGDNCEYDVATVPPQADTGWGPAPNGDTIGLDVGCGGSLVCQAPGGQTCLRYGDFSYFQTMVDVPAGVVVTQFTITFSGMDDGSRITIYNSAYPAGIVVPGSYVYLGGSGTSNLKDYVVSGELNRVVVTQVDDCCCENHLHEARVVLNGEEVHTGCSSNAGCDDGDACTTDTCNPDGSCSHAAISCDDGDACTGDACNPASGCTHTAVSCDDHDACTADACNPDGSCSHTAISCDDGDACTGDTCNPASGCAHATISCDDGNGCTLDTCDSRTGCSNVNQCPDCSHALPTAPKIWPPNHRLVPVGVTGVTDPQGQTISVRIDRVSQDEPTNGLGDGDTCPDADGVGTPTAQVRAERSGTRSTPGNGRVYHVYFTATDPDGYQCTGEIGSCVPHDQGGRSECVDDGALYDSLVCR